MKKSDVIDIMSQLDGILSAIYSSKNISVSCATCIERKVLNIKTIIFCENKFFSRKSN